MDPLAGGCCWLRGPVVSANSRMKKVLFEIAKSACMMAASTSAAVQIVSQRTVPATGGPPTGGPSTGLPSGPGGNNNTDHLAMARAIIDLILKSPNGVASTAFVSGAAGLGFLYYYRGSIETVMLLIATAGMNAAFMAGWERALQLLMETLEEDQRRETFADQQRETLSQVRETNLHSRPRPYLAYVNRGLAMFVSDAPAPAPPTDSAAPAPTGVSHVGERCAGPGPSIRLIH